jgi:hypothetical protein
MDIEKEINAPALAPSVYFESNTQAVNSSKIAVCGIFLYGLKMATYIAAKYSLQRTVVARGIGSGK